ncbi:hypothetical protein [Komagataeibacter sp. SM21]
MALVWPVSDMARWQWEQSVRARQGRYRFSQWGCPVHAVKLADGL